MDILAEAERFVERVHADDTSGHDWWHIVRVRATAKAIAQEEGADLFIVELAALLHDVNDWKLAKKEMPVRMWLVQHAVDEQVIDHVCRIIDELAYKGSDVPTPMSTLEGAVVQDADRLDALGAIGIARAFTYGGYKGQQMHHPAIMPQAHHSFESYKAHSGTTITHFYEKLLLLKERLNTKTAKRTAEERHAFMERYLLRFFAEWAGEQ